MNCVALFYINVIQITNNFGKEGKMDRKIALIEERSILRFDIKMIDRIVKAMDAIANKIVNYFLSVVLINVMNRSHANHIISWLKLIVKISCIKTTLQPIDTLQKQTLHYIHTTKSL